MKVCVHCFNDLELKQFIVSNSIEKGKCDYCENGLNSELIEIDELLDFFAEFIQIFKSSAIGIPLAQMIQKDWDLFSGEATCNNILSDILLALKSPFINTDITVDYTDDIIECSSYWDTLKEEIKWKKRFLTNIDKLEELGWIRHLSQTVQLPEKELFFRARLHYSGNQKEIKIAEMGCPDNLLVQAGRANPPGIPYLYLSKNVETTLYEVRASFLDEVSVGTFKTKDNSKIILVDFTESASAFSKVDEIVEYTKRMLLKRYISADLSKPIRRYDSEIEYIPTQFICEYIRYINNKDDIIIDGILFNSSLHSGGKNIVLFEQEKVECISVTLHQITKVEIQSRNI
ncbi:MAG: RES domain-containing protein [Candidatus Izemoplasmatales bacterium]|nr:RES domain-containing protein [Candidatus Izemoplasmatales bacterium]